MLLEGSCHCKAVRFSVEANHPYPFNLCYCSICRKTAGGGGYAINLSGDYATLDVSGGDSLRVYQVMLPGDGTEQAVESPCRRHFCETCGSALWVWDPRWPDLVHPFASEIDTDLPIPPERTHLMLGSKANWVTPHLDPQDKEFSEYPKESIASWHQRLHLES